MIPFLLLSLPVFGTPGHPKLFPFTKQRVQLQYPTPPSVTVYGYHAYWTGDVLDIDLNPLTHIAVFNVDLNADGTLSDTHNWTNVAQELVPNASQHKVLPCCPARLGRGWFTGVSAGIQYAQLTYTSQKRELLAS